MAASYVAAGEPRGAGLHRAKHPYTRALLAAEPKPDPAARRGPILRLVISADDLKVWFPVKRGLLRNTVGHIKAVERGQP